MPFICVICRETLEDNNSPPSSNSSPFPSNLYKKLFHKDKDNTEKNNLIVATTCGHTYHFECINNWLTKFNSFSKCPSCNQQIYKYELIQLFPAEEDLNLNSNKEHKLSAFSPYLTFSIEKEIQEIIILLESLGSNSNLEQRQLHQQQLLEALNKQLKTLHLHLLSLNRSSSIVLSHNNSSTPNPKANLQQQHLKSEIDLKEDPQGLTCYSAQELLHSIGKSTSSSSSFTSTLEECSCGCKYCSKSASEISAAAEEGYKDAQGGFKRFLSTLIKWKNKDKSLYLKGAQSELKSENKYNNTSVSVGLLSEDAKLKGLLSKELRLGDKIAWKLRGSYQLGVIKWKGFVGSRIHAGIEFNKPIGLIGGEESLKSLFKAKENHARLVPWDELLPQIAFNSNNNSSNLHPN